MEYLGSINNRAIFYTAIRDNLEWLSMLPTEKWLAFTIVDQEDKAILYECISEVLDKNVAYLCSTGALASLTEDYFDGEIVWRAVQYEEKTGREFDYDLSPMTTMHQNFEEGFWFASTLAFDDNKEINKVVCMNFTKRKLKNHLIELVEKINHGWLPPDED